MDRRLGFSVIIGIVLVVTLAIPILLFLRKSYEDSLSENATCSTPGCVHAAALVSRSIDLKVEPCDDFYEFACGGFEKSTTIPDYRISASVWSVVKDHIREQIRFSLEAASRPAKLRTFKLTKNLYRMCMNASAIEKTRFEPLHFILKKLGGWPVLEEDHWKGAEFNFNQNMRKCFDLGYFHHDEMELDGLGSENFIESVLKNANLDVFKPSLPRDYLIEGLENKVVKAYYDYMVDIAVVLGANEERAAKELKDSLEFETKLANISWSKEIRGIRGLLNTTITTSEVGNQYLNVREENISDTPRRAQANYLMWRVVQESIKYLTEDLRAREIDYQTILNGRKAKTPRWMECVNIVSESMPVGIGALFIRDHFDRETKKQAEDMFTSIKEGFVEILEQAKWMDNGTKTRALKKAASMSANVAFPEELLNDTKLEEYYAGFKPTADDLLSTVLDMNVFQRKKLMEYLRKPANETDWIYSSRAAVVNAFYSPRENNIQVPAGILQGSFFSSDRPQYMNYGAIGAIIGHEVTHGFDNENSKFDKDGNLNWWNPEAKAKYLNKTKCMFNQYKNYTDESVGLKLNGFRTLTENIADNGGFRSAYIAFKNWAKRNGPEPKLPGLDFTPEQMFWISAANTWCTRYRPEAMKLHIMQNVHSPARFRVIGPFSNNPDFSADFNCPSGSTMNPVDKCSVW